MKRDMDLIKFLLAMMENAPSGSNLHPAPSDFPEEERPSPGDLNEHCRLVVERGLARGTKTSVGWVLTGLTWDGHDFLDNSRDSKVWRAAKNAAGHLSFGVFVRVLSEVATRYAMSQIVGF